MGARLYLGLFSFLCQRRGQREDCIQLLQCGVGLYFLLPSCDELNDLTIAPSRTILLGFRSQRDVTVNVRSASPVLACEGQLASAFLTQPIRPVLHARGYAITPRLKAACAHLIPFIAAVGVEDCIDVCFPLAGCLWLEMLLYNYACPWLRHIMLYDTSAGPLNPKSH